jgi:hypothetical protein
MSTRVGVLSLLLICASTPGALAAQDKTSAAKSGKHASRKAAPDKAKPKPKTKQSEPHTTQSAAESKPARPVAPPPSAAGQAVDDEDVRREGGTDVKSVEFGGLDIEGQLKTPQMLYFLNRLRAEFDRPELPHRSFMPELQRSTREKDF